MIIINDSTMFDINCVLAVLKAPLDTHPEYPPYIAIIRPTYRSLFPYEVRVTEEQAKEIVLLKKGDMELDRLEREEWESNKR